MLQESKNTSIDTKEKQFVSRPSWGGGGNINDYKMYMSVLWSYLNKGTFLQFWLWLKI